MSADTLNLQVTYRELIQHLAERAPPEGFHRVIDLPELTHAALAAVVRHYPSIFLDAMCEYDRELRALVPEVLEHSGKPNDRCGLMGLHLVGALRRYALPLVLRDVQLRCEQLRAADAIEVSSGRREVLTADQAMADQLGLGRTLQ
jgi:hypothetical protein